MGLDLGGDGREDGADLGPQEEQRNERDDGDEGHDERVLDEPLPVLRGSLRRAPAVRHSLMTAQMKPMKMKKPAKSPIRAGPPTVFAGRFRLARNAIAPIQSTRSSPNR